MLLTNHGSVHFLVRFVEGCRLQTPQPSLKGLNGLWINLRKYLREVPKCEYLVVSMGKAVVSLPQGGRRA